MREAIGYLILPYRPITSGGRMFGAVLNVLWHLFVAYGRYGESRPDIFGLFDSQLWFGVTMLLLGVQLQLIFVALGRYRQSGTLARV